MATVLIEFRARTDMPFEDGETPLHAAAIAGALGMVLVFINAGVNKFELVREVVAHNKTLLSEVGGGSTASAGVSMVMWQLGHWSAVASNVSPKVSFFVLRRWKSAVESFSAHTRTPFLTPPPVSIIFGAEKLTLTLTPGSFFYFLTGRHGSHGVLDRGGAGLSFGAGRVYTFSLFGNMHSLPSTHPV